MALRLGIGDTLTLCKGAIDYCSRTAHDEPEDARILIADMCLMRSHLQCLSKQMGDEKAFAASRPDISLVIQRSLAPIQKDISEMKQMLQECKSKRKPSLHIVDRVRYHMLYQAKLDSFREKIPAHRKSLSEMGTLIEAQTHSERRESIVRLGSLVEEQEGKRGEEEEDESCRSELLGLLEEHVEGCEEGSKVSEMLEVVRQDLIARGYEEESVEKQMGEIRDALMLPPTGIYHDGDQSVKGPEALQLERFKF